MTALLLLLLLLPPSLTALSQDILLSLPTLGMASRLLPLHHRGTYPSARSHISEFHKDMLIISFNALSLLTISYNASSQPASYSQSTYSQPAAYGQQQSGFQAQQASYGQQPGYQQQTQQQQQAPPAYPPQASGSYGQPPASQYSQQGGPPSYNQSNHYSKRAQPCIMNASNLY